MGGAAAQLAALAGGHHIGALQLHRLHWCAPVGRSTLFLLTRRAARREVVMAVA